MMYPLISHITPTCWTHRCWHHALFMLKDAYTGTRPMSPPIAPKHPMPSQARGKKIISTYQAKLKMIIKQKIRYRILSQNVHAMCILFVHNIKMNGVITLYMCVTKKKRKKTQR